MADSNKSTDPSSSTIKSYVDSAIGTVQETVGGLLGNTTDQAQGQVRQEQGKAEHDLSHATVKAGPFTASGAGAVTKDDPNRSQGSWNQTVGAAKEALGGLIGNESLKQAGAQQNAEGKGQEAQGQLTDLGKGVTDRVQGAVGGAIAGASGDKAEQARYQQVHDTGKTLQRGVEHDLQKQGPK